MLVSRGLRRRIGGDGVRSKNFSQSGKEFPLASKMPTAGEHPSQAKSNKGKMSLSERLRGDAP